MNQPGWSNNYQRQNKSTGFFIWLGDNMIQIGILLVLIVGGVIGYIALNKSKHQENSKTTEKPEFTLKDWREARSKSQSRYANADCRNDLHCPNLKRIHEDGGASPEAIRKNLLAADRSITFEQLQANTSRYKGTAWAFEGKIHDIIGLETRGFNDYIVAEIRVGDDPDKRVTVRGDFATTFNEGDYVYVVGYTTGMAFPQMDYTAPTKKKVNFPSMTARALLKPSEAREILYGSSTN
jgi:hypothetical protein